MSDKKQLSFFEAFGEEEEKTFKPGNTAMGRSRPSPIARKLFESGKLKTHGVKSILDFGCGRGADVQFYQSKGFLAKGYDPHTPFGCATEPNGCFDMVSCLFVLNVIPNDSDRMKALESAVSYVTTGGLLVISARTKRSIEQHARSRSWERYGDGYISSESRRTFQVGLDYPDLEVMVRKIAPVDCREVKISADASCLFGLIP